MNPTRPVPRFVRVWAILTAVVGFGLLFVLGGFVTSFRVGMADPVWPTAPWYLAGQDWHKLEFGFLVEHTHRAAGWIFGALCIVLTVGAWWSEPKRPLKFGGFGAIIALVGGYGSFHGAMMAAGAKLNDGTPLRDIDWSVARMAGIFVLAMAGLVLLCAMAAASSSRPGRWPRALSLVLLVAVMIQGLLGGFRVLLNALFGPLLAAYHGVFAQFVFCLVVAIAVLSASPNPRRILPEPFRGRMTRLGWTLTGVVFLQLVFGAMVRHTGTPLAQRLHILTAFAVAGTVVWIAAVICSTPAARAYRGLAFHLLGLLVLQIMLGVEAYLVKFAAVGPQATTLPELRTITKMSAGLRTVHLLVGLGLLASALVLALRANRAVSAAEASSPDTITRATRPEPAAAD
ncbi:MAG TPA: COX15/CtaA family protein [Fimbriiglobus sp.]|jgi:heme A synthase